VAFSAGGDGGSSVLLEQSARRARSAYMCGVVRNGCCDVSALAKPAFSSSAAPPLRSRRVRSEYFVPLPHTAA